MTRALLVAALAAALLSLAPAAYAIEVGMEPTSKELRVHNDAGGEVNELSIYRTANSYRVEATEGSLSVSGTWPTDCTFSADTPAPGTNRVTCIHGGGIEPFEADVSLGGGDDRLSFDDPTMSGPVKGDEVHGNAGRDDIQGGAADDRLWGDEDGDFKVDGGPGADQVDGGDGNDYVSGGNGSDLLFGGRGGDSLADLGTGGTDTLFYSFETDLTRTGAVTLTLDHGTAGNDGGVDDGAAGARDTIGPGIERVNGTGFDDSMTGSGANETLSGSFGKDTLDGGHGSDTLFGGAGDDTLKARDGASDAEVNCDASSNDGTADTAEVDGESVDTNVVHCETVSRPSSGGGGTTDPGTGGGTTDPGTGGGTTNPGTAGGTTGPTGPSGPSAPSGGGTPDPGGGEAPPTLRPQCPSAMDAFLRSDYDVDKFLAGKMNLKVSLPEKGWTATAGVYGFKSFGVILLPVPKSNTPTVTARAPGVQSLKLGATSESRSEFAGKTTQAYIGVGISAPDCPSLGLFEPIELAPAPDGRATTPVATEARATPVPGRGKRALAHAAQAHAAQSSGGRYWDPCAGRPPNEPQRNFACPQDAQPRVQPRNCGGSNTSGKSYTGHLEFSRNIDVDGCLEVIGYQRVSEGGGLTRQASSVYKAVEKIKMNGLTLDPANGASIVFDQEKVELRAEGRVRAYFSILGPDGAEHQITLFDRSGSWSLSKDQLLAGKKHFGGETNILGFPIAGDMTLDFAQGDATKAGVRVALPALFGGAQAAGKFTIPKNGQVQIDEITLDVPEIRAYNFTLRDLHLKYFNGPDPVTKVHSNAWYASGKVEFPSIDGRPGPNINIQTMWKDGAFVRGYVEAKDFPRSFGAGVKIEQISGELTLRDPLKVEIKARVNFGPEVAPGVPPALAVVDGTLRYTGPKVGPGEFFMEVAGNTKLRLWKDLGSAQSKVQISYRTDGKLTFAGAIGIDFGKDFNAFAALAGTYQHPSFNAVGTGTVRIGSLSATGFAQVNNVGAVGCFGAANDAGGGAAGGGRVIWKTGKVDLFTGCGFEELKPVASASQAGQRTVTIPAGLPRAAIAVLGQGGATVTGPDKTTHQPFASTADAVYFVVDKPRAGAYTVVPQPGARITGVQLSRGSTAPKLDVKVERMGTGNVRVESSGRGLSGEEDIVFSEVAAGLDREVGRLKGPNGVFRFKPADAGPRKRKLMVTVTRNGVPTGERFEVASFSAQPPPRPGAPGTPKFRRGGADLVVSWTAASDAEEYMATVREEDGRRHVYYTSAQRLKIKAVGENDDVTVWVRGINEDGESGPEVQGKHRGKNRAARKPRPLRLPDSDDVGYVEVLVKH